MSLSLDAELSAVMDSLLQAAVTGLQRLSDTGDTRTTFSSMMETLCNEALGKILSILEPVKLQLKLDKLANPPSTNPQVLYILQDSRVGVEHSYGAVHKRRKHQPNTEQMDHCYGANDQKTDKGLPGQKDGQSEEEDSAHSELIPATSIKDKWDNISLETIVEETCYSASHAMSATKENNQSATDSENGTPKRAAQDNLSHSGTEESIQNEDRSEEDERVEPASFPDFTIKRENDESTLQRVEEMYDSMTFSPTSYTSDLKASDSVPQRQHFTCSICESVFDSENALKKHTSSHTGDKPFKCPSCDSSYHQSASLKRHMYKHTGERPFKCPECGKGFTDRDKLKGHMSVHTGQKGFPCSVCGKSFTAKTNLYRHMRLHSGERPYICSECGRSYSRPETLKFHMSTSHSSGTDPPVQSYKCSFCDRVFSQKTNLTVHERIHTGERPYVCSLCSKTFRTSLSLKVHLRVHTGEKPYICDVCGRPFSQQSSLSVHRRVHMNERNYVCATCSKSFNNPQNLKVHLRVHTGERPFACGLCSKTFIQDAHLRIHKQHMHAGVKQCVCEHCGKAYADRRNLRLHKCVYK